MNREQDLAYVLLLRVERSGRFPPRLLDSCDETAHALMCEQELSTAPQRVSPYLSGLPRLAATRKSTGTAAPVCAQLGYGDYPGRSELTYNGPRLGVSSARVTSARGAPLASR